MNLIPKEELDDLVAISEKIKNLPYGYQMLVKGAIIALDASAHATPHEPKAS